MQTRKPMPKEYVNKLKEHPYVVKATEWTIDNWGRTFFVNFYVQFPLIFQSLFLFV